ncbi:MULTISPECIES: dihydrodipicolinate synthase family protein [unclassified Prochlorococcus]|uniref:dihydrodipicolinate synthase family protein n=1 Tax=unclassified Prochlorococcus TaxID=2627481 RepID=UPI00097CD430|nr:MULTISPECIES: dihydrodipicolinate synthase family protein [unclassified Prochlorococcus]AQL29792.1 hypothetical protein BSR22_00735 [Prochlorococcus sp. RS50]AQL31577.1 hypothetical protein BS620_00740 [Prochlorococcus sp. RS01]AQL34529.1 hypothetical protein BS621_07060 [Prochlorococcus sp. RS04]
MKTNLLSDLKESLDGPIFTIFTPYKEDFSIDYFSIEKYINFLFEGGAKVFYVMAYNSRYSQLSNKEIIDLNNFCIKCVKKLDKKNIIIVADPIHCSTQESIKFSLSAKENGGDAISLIMREKYFSDDQVLEHFYLIGEHTNFPIIIHEMPFLSGYDGKQINWPKSLILRLEELNNILAIKEDAKNIEISKLVLSCEPNIRTIFAGTKKTFLPLKKYGLKSYLNGISIINPRIGIKFWEFWKDNDFSGMNWIIENLENPFFEGPVSKFGWHRCNKAILQASGHMHRRDRMPMPTLKREEFKEIELIYETIKNNIDDLFS